MGEYRPLEFIMNSDLLEKDCYDDLYKLCN